MAFLTTFSWLLFIIIIIGERGVRLVSLEKSKIFASSFFNLTENSILCKQNEKPFYGLDVVVILFLGIYEKKEGIYI